MPILKKTMFREYDIRGEEKPDELTDEAMYFIGQGFGVFLKRRNIQTAVIGHDARASSEKFHQNFIRGFLQTGADVINIGISPTPMGYWAQHFLQTKGVAIITASHNPAGWNGVKLGDGLSKTLIGSEIEEIYQIISKEDFPSGRLGTVMKRDLLENYLQDIISKVKIDPDLIGIDKKFKVLVNTGNGTAGLLASRLLKDIGCEVVELHTNIDPTYPHYTPNPEQKVMMDDTSLETVKNNCDLGFAFDGDGDRLGVVDEKGAILPPDRYLVLLSRLVLKNNPKAKFVFDVKVSEALPEDIKNHGGSAILWKTGHSLIKAKMAEVEADLAGEMSGHIFFSQGYYGFDDAFFTALKILECLSVFKQTLSKALASTPYYISTPTIHVETTDEDKYGIVQNLVLEFKKEGFKVLDVDGARVYTEDGWGLVRASNTTPKLVLRFESKTREGLERIRELFGKKLDKYDKVSKDWEESAR